MEEKTISELLKLESRDLLVDIFINTVGFILINYCMFHFFNDEDTIVFAFIILIIYIFDLYVLVAY